MPIGTFDSIISKKAQYFLQCCTEAFPEESRILRGKKHCTQTQALQRKLLFACCLQ